VSAEPLGLHVALFFTRGLGLRDWLEGGGLEREVAIYRRIQAAGGRVSFVTYGDGRDLELADRLPGFDICCNRWGLPEWLYARLLPMLHHRVLRSCDVIKTNQTSGGEVALAVARVLDKPLVARCGYMASEFIARQEGAESAPAKAAFELERRLFSGASRIVVTTDAMAEDVCARLPECRSRVQVIPNYVDTDLFRPDPSAEPDVDLLYVGRMAPQKNFEALVSAIEPLDVRLRVVGSHGQAQLERIGDLGGRIHWAGKVANEALPAMMARARALALPSHYEGHPKVLIEAMACGLPPIGGDSPGIRQFVRDRETGLLCGTSADEIRRAIETMLNDEVLRRRIACQARAYAIEQFSLDRIFSLEREMLTAVSDSAAA
jgi:hypothetical protein